MSSIKNAYDTVVTTVISPISTVEKALQQRKQRTAQRRIDKQASKEAEVCLTLGRSYRQQNNLLAARDVYKQGLSSLSMDDAQHIHLQKELQTVSATIRAYNRQLFIIPNEIWYRVFRHIRTYRDLWQCAMAFNTWYYILINLSEFWNPPWCTDSWDWVSKRHSASNAELSTLQIGRTGPSPLFLGNEWWFKDLFNVLACCSANAFSTLVFKSMDIPSSLAYCVAQMLQSINPPVRQVVFGSNTSMEIPDVKFILDSSSRTEHIAFSGHLKYCKEFVSMHGIELTSVTHLQWTFDSEDGLRILPGVIRRCPNLIHLTMDDNTYKYTTYYRRGIEQALECCPRLKFLNVGTRLKLTDKEETKIDHSYSSTGTDSSGKHLTTRGIHTLKYLYWWTHDDFYFIMEKSYKSLESLYLSYSNYQDKHTDLQPLSALYGAPNLRKTTFRLWSNDYTELPSSIINDLIAFFTTTSSLEEIVIDFGWYHSEDYIIPKVSDVLLAIGKNCRLLRRLEVIGNIRLTADTMFKFAAAAGSNLTHLEIPMDDQSCVVDLVQKITTLVHFRFSNNCYNRYDRNDSNGYTQQSWSYIDSVERIMKERRASISRLLS